MDSTTQQCISIVQSADIQDANKRTLAAFLEKNGITNDFFALLKKILLSEIEQTGKNFSDVAHLFDEKFSTLEKQLNTEEAKLDEALSQQLSETSEWDMNKKRIAIEGFANKQKILYQVYQKKLSDLGIQFAEASFGTSSVS